MSQLATYLRNLGCLCSFARSLPEACALLLREKFSLVLSKFVLSAGGCHDLVSQMEGGDASLFYSFVLEDSCLWIPRVRNGKQCWGEPALRPYEFARLLKDLIHRMLGNSQLAEGRTTAEPITMRFPRRGAPPLRTAQGEAHSPAGDADLGADQIEFEGAVSNLARSARR